MQELVQHLCRIVADRLQSQPQMPTADLVTAVLAQIAGDDRWQKLLDDSRARIVQNNSGDARGYQVRVDGGVVYVGNEKVFNISGDNVAGDKVTGDKVSGDKYVYNFNANEAIARSAIKLILKRLGLVLIGIPNNINRTGCENFVGRDEALVELDQLLQASELAAVTALQGMGGIGKTELALQYALEQLRAKTHTGGVCWLRGREDVGGQIEIFAQTKLGLELPENLKNQNTLERAKYYWDKWPVEGAVLVVIDDVLDYAAIKGYLPPVETQFRVLLTSRLELGSGIQRLALGVIDPAAALDLLRGLIGSMRVEGELADAEYLCEWLGYLPLGIELVGRYLGRNRTLTLAKMQKRLNEKRLAARGLIQHDVAMTATHVSLAAAFEVSWEDLGNQAVFAAPVGEYARQLGALLSLFAVAPIVWEWVVECLPEWDEEDLEAARDEGLMALHLLQMNDDNTYQLHQLVREFLINKQNTLDFSEEQKYTFCKLMVELARRIAETATNKLITTLASSIPHLLHTATVHKDYLSKEDLIAPFMGLAHFYKSQISYDLAKSWCEKCLNLAKESFGKEHSDVATCLHNLAYLSESQGRYNEAESFLLEAIEIRKLVLGNNDLDVATSLNNLASINRSQGKYDRAESLLLETLRIRKLILDENHPDMAQSFNNLALIYVSQGRYFEAENLYQKAIELIQYSQGDDNYEIAMSFNNLAQLYYFQKKYSDAEKIFNLSLQLLQNILGENHPDVAISLNNLALVSAAKKCHVKAIKLYKQAIKIQNDNFGDSHPDLATSFNNIAECYRLQDDHLEAEFYHMKALNIRKLSLGDNHLDVSISLNNLGLVYLTQQRYDEAESHLRQSLEIRKRSLSSKHPDVVASLNNLKEFYYLHNSFLQ
jgi:tetratricopeptide (TPR) repeat protein